MKQFLIVSKQQQQLVDQFAVVCKDGAVPLTVYRIRAVLCASPEPFNPELLGTYGPSKLRNKVVENSI